MKNKMVYIAVFLCLAGLAVAAEYTDFQKGALEGLNWGFKMGQAYQLAMDGKDVAGFNEKVDEYNIWVRANFGENNTLLMEKMPEGEKTPEGTAIPKGLQNPVLINDDTTARGGIVHEMDGSWGTYSTGDMNTLPDQITNHPNTWKEGGEYLSYV